MADGYQPHTWSPGEAITDNLMNALEIGVRDAYQKAIQGVSDAGTVSQNLTTLSGTVETVSDTANRAWTVAHDSQQGAVEGKWAWTQLKGAGVVASSEGVVSTSLKSVLDGINNKANTNATSIGDLITIINGATQQSTPLNLADNQIDSLNKRIGDIYNKIQTVSNTASTAASQFTSNRILERLNAIDTIDNLAVPSTRTIHNIIDELKNAHSSHVIQENGLDKKFVSDETNATQRANGLDNRFEYDESLIIANSNNITNLTNNKVNTSDIRNNTNINSFTYTDTDKPLSAKNGKDLRDIIGGTYDPYNTNTANRTTVTKAIETAQTNAVNTATSNAQTYTDGLLGTGFTTTDTVRKALTDMTTAYGNADSGLSTRIDNINTAIGTDTTADTIKGRIKTLEDTVDDSTTGLAATKAIADEALSTANAAAVASTVNTALDGINTKINTIATELEMLDNGAIVDTNTRIDTLASNLATAEGNITNLSTNKADLSYVNTQLGTKANASDVTEALAGKASATSVSDLTTTVNGLLDRDTIVIDKPQSGSNYTNNIPNIATAQIKPNCDYLIADDEGKYFYWRYINNNWELISSAGGGGSGNTSGYDLSETAYSELTSHTENTDYYVTKTDGVHHYRWIPGANDTLTEIEISNFIDTSNIKTYNATTSTTGEGNDQVTYLDLYEFNYGVNNTVIDPQASTLRAHIPLPKGGGGSNNNITARLVRIGEETVPVIVNSKVNLYVFFSAWDSDQSYSGNYTFKYNNTTIDTGTFASGAVNATPINWVVVEEPEFNNDVPVINAPDTTKLYIVKTGNTFTQWTYANSTWSSIAGAPAGFYALDISNYCKTASINNIFSLSVSYGTDTTPVGKTWKVNIYDLYIESEAPETLLINSTSSYGFVYTAFGALDKTLHVLIDNQSVGTKNLNASTSGRADTFTITPKMIQDAVGYIHGVHKIEMYLTADIGGITRTTSRIARDYIWYDVTDTDTPIIIASPYRGQTLDVQQYSTLSIPYQVYQKDTDEITVKYYLDNVLYDEVHLDRINEGIFNYVVTTDEGTHTIKIMVEEEYIEVILNVSEMKDVNISPIEDAIIDFDPSTLSNSSINRLPSWTVGQTTYAFTASPNFNWSEDISGGGYKEDVNHEKCFVIKAGSYIDLNYPMFANNVFNTGAEMKITFKTAAVRNAEAVWYQNIGEISGKTVGVQLNAHNGWLKTDKAVSTTTLADEDSDEDTITVKGITYNYWKTNTAYNVEDIIVIRNTIYRCIKAADAFDTNLQDKAIDLDEDPAKSYLKKWLKIGQLDTEVLATNSYLYFPYSEEDKIELDININKSETNNNFIMSYEDGVPSKAYAYTTGAGGDKITHNGTIRIGSDDCDVYIYRLRYYAEALTTAQILQNFIADGATIDDKINRYNRNCVYWDSTQERYFTSPSPTASLDPVKLAERMPDVKILMLETPTFTTGKKDFVQGASLRCLHVKGGKVYESRGDEDNWFFYNGFHAGQGTTSDNYGQAGRNVDFLFEVDGTNYPTKAKNMSNYTPSQDYVSKVVIGEDASEWVETAPNSGVYHWVAARQPETNEVCDDWKGDKCKISLTESSVPNNYFNLKVNIASSENVNNALFQKRYDDFLLYQSPAQSAQVAKHHDTYENIADVVVKNGMEFVPAVLFIRETGVDVNGNPVARNEFNDDKWHFYALGNMGDSKKSDYTRAYDPDDMNEFTCENSDNNTNNGQFQSGVFTYQGHEGAIETDYPAWRETVAYETGATVVYNGMVYTRTGANQEALEENETYSWVAADWTAITYTGWNDQDPPYFAPRTNPNPMEYTYPITSSQWNVKLGNTYLNRKHMTLVTEEFDGDHSFEFRYACKGDYRDGDLINDTNGNSEILKDPSDASKGYKTKDDVQFDINHDVVLAMYEWLITATPEQYANEAPQWFVKNAMEFFYAYTHYYTMMDNRAKNTFWHFAKTGVHRPVSRPVEALYHVYEVADGTVTVSNGVATGNFKKPEGSFNPSGTYYTQYAFDLWVYDCDTAVGIDNNGALVFPYGKEDEDYRVDGEPSSGYAFNGAGSIFWRRLKTTFASEIASIMDQADKRCFNSEDLIKEFDNFQSCFPEEIWRLDIERKYIRTYTGASIDNSIVEGKQNARFLMSMMQGRKKYQRRQWIRDQGFYFNSKYNIGDISTNRTEFNIVSPAGDHSLLAVQPDYHLRLTPYQDMYLNVVVGNGTPIPPIRAKANQEYTIKLDDYAAGNFAETRVYIGGFKMISKLGGLAPMYPYSFTLNGLDHLKELDVGTDNSGYRNGNFTELPLTNEVNLPLLETLNIQNCNALATSIGLRTANNLRTVEAIGSSIGGITLPEYTQIETLHLPSTVTDIVLHGARFLKDFIVADRNGTANYTNLYTLDIYDSDYSANYKDNPSDPLPIDWLSIAIDMLEKQSPQTNLSLVGLYSATIGNIQEMNPIVEAKEIIEADGGQVYLEGLIHVTGHWSDVEINDYHKIWPKVTFDTIPEQREDRYKVTYKYADENGVTGATIYETYVNKNAEIIDPWFNGLLAEKPHHDPTVSHIYTFGTEQQNIYLKLSGWALQGEGRSIRSMSPQPRITDNTVIEAFFTLTDHEYPIEWHLKRENAQEAADKYLIKTSANPVPYGGGYDEAAPTIQEIHAKHFNTAEIQINSNDNPVTATYSIFTGWEKLPTNINPNATDTSYNIYGVWETDTKSLVDIFANNSTVSEEVKLLVASGVANKSTYDVINNYFIAGRRFTTELGYEGTKAGTTLINSNNITRFDIGDPEPLVYNNIKPLSSADGFTLAIDYCFAEHIYNPTNETAFTHAALMGCYEEYTQQDANQTTIVNGFALYEDLTTHTIKVGYGDMFRDSSAVKTISSSTVNNYARNILVLRRPNSESEDHDKLYIYSGFNATATTPSEVHADFLTWNSALSNAILNFGQLTADNSSEYDDIRQIVAPAHGTIYWAKYWPEDLGVGECRQLAAWPHESLTYAIQQINNTRTSDNRADENTDPATSLVLTTVSGSQHGHTVETYMSNPTDGTEYGWDNFSTTRTLFNNRLVQGLPIKLQSIICKPKIMTKRIKATYPESAFAQAEYVLSTMTTPSRDYLYALSICNLDSTKTNYLNESNTTKLNWLNEAHIDVYTYNPTGDTRWTVESHNPTYLNLRFPGIETPYNMRVFKGYSSITNYYNGVNQIAGKIQRGDVYIDPVSSKAYIYVDVNDVTVKGIQTKPSDQNDEFSCAAGGWVEADGYWLRSISSGGRKASFMYVQGQTGASESVVVESNQNNAPSTGLGFTYSFTV